MWNNIRDLGLAKTKFSKDKPLFDSDDINEYFIDSVGYDPSQSKSVNFSDMNEDDDRRLKFSVITEGNVRHAIYKIRSNAIGDDNIPLLFVKMILPIILHVITHIFNTIIQLKIFPDCWKVGIIKPRDKVKDVRSIKDLRPICLLSGISKAFESCLCEQIYDHLNLNKLLNPYQSAYRKKHSTCTALMSIIDDLYGNFQSGSCSLIIMLDCTKAFDLVDHNDLLQALFDELLFSRDAVLLVHSYLSERFQYVHYDEKLSGLLPVPCGVPQGSLMGPLLFSLNVNNLPDQLDASTDRGLYADDFQFIIHGHVDNMSEMIDRANSELEKISSWFKMKRLRLNASKSMSMFVSCSNLTIPNDLPKIVLDGSEISFVDNAKNLGLFLDKSLKFDKHVNEMVRKVYYSLHSLRINKLYLSSEMKVRLVKALVIPHFLYCDIIISCVNAALKSKIEKAFKSVLRFCFNLRKRESTQDFSNVIFGCNIWKYFDFRFSIFIFKVICFQEPKYLFDKLKFSKSSRTCNLIIPRFTNKQKDMFSVRAAELWNKLPNEVKRMTDLNEFSKASFKFFAEQ